MSNTPRQTPSTKNPEITLTVISDPGHAWAMVPYADIENLGIERRVSSCSYRNGETVALEEDCDMGLYVTAMSKSLGVTEDALHLRFDEKHQEETEIRQWPAYSPGRIQ